MISEKKSGNRFVSSEPSRQHLLSSGFVVPDAARCVQCGICSFNCPLEIDVRRYAWLGKPVKEKYCLTCGECVDRCPRGALRFEQTNIFKLEKREMKV